MTILPRLPRIVVPAVALAIAVTPLANPLLLALAALAGGLLLAYRCTADLLASGLQAAESDTVFRHYV